MLARQVGHYMKDIKSISMFFNILHKRYKEHFHDFKYNTKKSSFATSLLGNYHSTGPINEIMEILHTNRKGKFMDTVERFHIYSETRNNNNQINDKNMIKPNFIFDVINSHNSPRTPTE
jgi:hypothetical protein